jgi:NADPH:quinone reductase-like Zn-dependent oxidoreductase
LKAIEVPEVNYIAALTASDKHFPHLVQVLAPQGKIGMIDDPAHVDVKLLKDKAASFHWELMFTRPMYQTPDMLAQHDLLSSIAKMVDEGRRPHHAGRTYGHDQRYQSENSSCSA